MVERGKKERRGGGGGREGEVLVKSKELAVLLYLLTYIP
jgi:hypothetical protein